MYEVSVEVTFAATHGLLLLDGQTEPLHGHDWHVTATFAGSKLDGAGMLIDFLAAKRALEQAIDPFQHACLDTVPAMDGLNPSAEHVAMVIHNRLAEAAPALAGFLDRVCVVEAAGCVATYFGRSRQKRT